MKGDDRPRNYWLRLALVVGVISLSFLSVIAVLKIAAALGIAREKLHGTTLDLTPRTVVILLGYMGTQIGIVLLVQRVVHGRPLRQLGFRGNASRDAALGFLIGVSIAGVQTALEAVAAPTASLHWMLPAGVSLPSFALYYSFWFCVLLTLNSLSEELMFRAYPIEHLAVDGSNGVLVLTFIAVAFSAVHNLVEPFELRSFVSRVLWAGLLTYLYDRTRSIWLICGVHNGSNFVPFTLGGNWKTGGLWELTSVDAPDATRIAIRTAVVTLAVVALHRLLPRRISS